MDWLTDMAAKRAELTPDKPAFVDHGSGTTLTFQDVNAQANQAARVLADLGLVAGDRIAVLCMNTPAFFVLLFAAQKSGIVLVPLNWRQPVAELGPVLKASKAKLLLHDRDFGETAEALANAAGVDLMLFADPGAADGLEARMATAPADPFGNGQIAAAAPWYLLFTSGTTGLPKAVIQTAGMAWANAVNYTQATGLNGSDKTVNYLPLFHTAGINLPTLPLFLLGGTSTILSKFDADAVVDLLLKQEMSVFFGVPAIYQALALHEQFGEIDFSSIHSLGCGGAPIPAKLLKDYLDRGVTICNGMGMTETGPTVFLMDPEHAEEKIGSVGKPQILADVRLEASDGSMVAGEGAGELQLRGPGITPGYMDNPSATKSSFTADGWLKSGDVAHRDADGYYYIVDRIKDMYISGGENVYPAEVEKVLVSHPSVMEAVVIGVPDEKWGEVGAAYLIAQPGAVIEVDEIRLWCREKLAAYKVPKSYQVATELPRTAAGKVRKNILKNKYLEQADKETVE